MKKLLDSKYFLKYLYKYGICGRFEDIKIVFTNFDDEDPSLDDYNAMEIKRLKSIAEVTNTAIDKVMKSEFLNKVNN